MTNTEHDRRLSPRRSRRAVLLQGAATWIAAAPLALSACATASAPAPVDWRRRLQGSTVALLGEVHDNTLLHQQRLQGLQQAVAGGWRPAVVMEQFDLDRQADIDRARRERPRDADHLIAQAGAPAGWDWAHYRPLIELVLANDLPLRAANLPRSQARLLVRSDWSAVFDSAQQQRLGLSGDVAARLQPAQEKAVDAGHCSVLPPNFLPGMARAQLARDAVMAQVLREQVQASPGRGAVLIAGNGHVRRDQGVPAWLADWPAGRMWVVGFVEPEMGDAPRARMFDAWQQAPAANRPDPCEALKARPGVTPETVTPSRVAPSQTSAR